MIRVGFRKVNSQDLTRIVCPWFEGVKFWDLVECSVRVGEGGGKGLGLCCFGLYEVAVSEFLGPCQNVLCRFGESEFLGPRCNNLCTVWWCKDLRPHWNGLCMFEGNEVLRLCLLVPCRMFRAKLEIVKF